MGLESDTWGGASKSSPVAETSAARQRVLLVEDNPGDAVLVGRLLTATQFDVDHVSNLRDASQRLSNVRYQAIVLDLRLPDTSPLNAVRELRVLSPETALVVLTALEDEELTFACLDAGAQDYIRKADLRSSTLARTLSHAIARQRATEMLLRLETSERHAALGRIAAAAAHEINNLSMALLSSTEFAIDRVDALLKRAPPRDRADLTALEIEVREQNDCIVRIAAIVKQLHALGRSESQPALELVELSEVVRRAINVLAAPIRQCATVECDFEPNCQVIASRQKLSQVLLNLLKNAIEALPGGDPAKDTIAIKIWRAGGEVRLSVTDSGTGIPEPHRARLFQPFFTSKPGGTGTGMGLAICAEIIHGLQGTIDVKSEFGVGSTFTIHLPEPPNIGAAKVASLPPPPTSTPDSTGRRQRVLLIDDDDNTRRAVVRALTEHHDVVDLARGADALRLLDQDESFDAVICDLMMPGMDGPDVCRVIRDRHPAVYARLAVLSGGSFTSAGEEFLDEWDGPVLMKPCGKRELLELVTLLTANGTDATIHRGRS